MGVSRIVDEGFVYSIHKILADRMDAVHMSSKK